MPSKQYLLPTWLGVLLFIVFSNRNVDSSPLELTQRAHPRLLVTPRTWKQLAQKRREDELLDAFLDKSEQDARALLAAEPVRREQIGRRLLTTSRRALRRIALWSLHCHLTGDKALAERAEKEMLAVAGFSDWNPSHFLDVAEMTAAMAIGYDWLYQELSTPARATIRQAIVEKGLRPGNDRNHWWLTRDNNWNQVCLGGLAMGALAVAEDEADLAAQILQLVKENNHHGLKPYAPDGVYPEGPMYWVYGSSYQVLLLASLQSALGTDFDLAASPGFLQSADALLQMTTPSGRAFNFSDGVEPIDIEPALFWFAHRMQKPELLRFQWPQIEKYAAAPIGKVESVETRLLPLIALWWPSKAERIQSRSTLPLRWLGRGENPLAVFRSSWSDSSASYLAVKGGGGANSHAHLDAGSFIYESDGVRWAKDLGKEDYNALETKGLKIWDKHQNADRWKIFRHSNLSHNTLTINGGLHNGTGHAEITHFSGDGEMLTAILDLTDVFKNAASKARRGFAYDADGGVLIRDEIEGLKPYDSVRWTMLTEAQVEVNGAEAVLRQSGKVLRARLSTAGDARWQVVPVESLMQNYDSPNPGSRLLIASVSSPASGKVEINVELLREIARFQSTSPNYKWPSISLDQWPAQPVR